MKKLFTITLLLAFAISGRSKPYYLFTDVSQSILSSGTITDHKPDDITWMFDNDNSDGSSHKGHL